MDPRARLLTDWRPLRDADQLGTLLPRCISRSWELEGELFGFVTLDYRVYRDLSLAASEAGADPVADLVEMYWSVRTRGGIQDPQWAVALNAHVVRVAPGALGVEDLATLYQLVVTLRRALQLGGIGGLVAEAKPVALHTRGLLLGSALSEPAAIVDALASHADVPLTVGRFEALPDGGFRFSGTGAEGRSWEQQPASPDLLQSLGERLLRHDRLFRSQGVWAPDMDSPSRPDDLV